MGHLTDVARCRYTAEADTEAKNEATAQELAPTHGCGLDAGTDDDDCGSGEHAPATTEHVVYRGCEEDGGDGADVVHGEDDTGR